LGHLAVPPAMTVVVTGIYEKAWLLEIEAIAMA
jgi:enamine deaminase RidA (YjgF/YER057c/UK114 family)